MPLNKPHIKLLSYGTWAAYHDKVSSSYALAVTNGTSPYDAYYRYMNYRYGYNW